MFELIQGAELKQDLKITLFGLLRINPYKFDADVFKLVSDGNTDYLTERFTDQISHNVFSANNLLIGPRSDQGYIDRNSHLYSRDLLLEWLQDNKYDPITKKPVGEYSYKPVDGSLLQPLFSESNNEPNNEPKINTPAAVANFIISDISIDIPNYEEQRELITEISQLGSYYDCLGSIKVLYMMIADNDKDTAIELLIKSLSGEKLPETIQKKCDLAFIKLRLRESEIEERLLQSYISNTVDPQEFLRPYVIKHESTNLFVDCMQILKKPDSGIEKLIVCGNLVRGMFEKIKNSEEALLQLSNFRSCDNDTMLHLVILAIYTLTSENNDNDAREDIISNLQVILDTLIKFSSQDFSDMNIVGETIFYPKLDRYFAGNPNLEKIFDAQKIINDKISGRILEIELVCKQERASQEINFAVNEQKGEQKSGQTKSSSLSNNKTNESGIWSCFFPKKQDEEESDAEEFLTRYLDYIQNIYCEYSVDKKLADRSFSVDIKLLKNEQKIVYLVCKLIHNLNKDKFNTARQKLIRDIWHCMYPEQAKPVQNISVVLMDKIDLVNCNSILSHDFAKYKKAESGLKQFLDEALKNPNVCLKASKWYSIKRIIHLIYKLFDRSNSDAIGKIQVVCK